jgi:hypothetical protein
MKDSDFDALKLKVSIIPSQLNWPTRYDHWERLHAAGDTVRDRAAKALAAMDEVDKNLPHGHRQEEGTRPAGGACDCRSRKVRRSLWTSSWAKKTGVTPLY